MVSPVKVSTGWTESFGESSTAEKKRSEDAKLIQPTPPRTQNVSHLPTPETLRRTSKRQPTKPTQPLTRNTSTTSSLPTPQTLPRTRSKQGLTSSNPIESSQPHSTSPLPSPNGHTTFFHSNTAANPPRDIPSKRRPGLTFAQQMGLLAQSQEGDKSSASTFGGRLGVGVGMGGQRSGAHGKVDRVGGVGNSRVAPSTNLGEDNPFLDTQPKSSRGHKGLQSPGMATRHRPRQSSVDSDTTQVSPLAPSKPKTHIQTQLSYQQILPLTPPPTKHKHTHRAKPQLPTQPQTQILPPPISERRKRMLDTPNNPFLSSPSSSRTHQPRYDPVDETRDTVTYVFRGSKKVFANPFLGMEWRWREEGLDVEDEEFEADQCPRPRLLWPTRAAGSTPEKAKGKGKRRDGREEKVTPPSSPVGGSVVTPRGGARGRKFSEGGLGGMESPGMDIGPGDVFSESEGEYLVDTLGEEDSDEDEERVIPVRRGLLFGGNGSGNGIANGVKRGLEPSGDSARKARKVMRI